MIKCRKSRWLRRRLRRRRSMRRSTRAMAARSEDNRFLDCRPWKLATVTLQKNGRATIIRRWRWVSSNRLQEPHNLAPPTKWTRRSRKRASKTVKMRVLGQKFRDSIRWVWKEIPAMMAWSNKKTPVALSKFILIWKSHLIRARLIVKRTWDLVIWLH